jgi:rSAM/selenodomain-associated transferase 1
MSWTLFSRIAAAHHPEFLRLNMELKKHLIIFARFPRLGAGKRRLARDIGQVQALRFQRVLLQSTVRRLANDPRWITWIAATPDRSGPWPHGVIAIPQGGGDLGQRMARAARLPPPGSVVIVGSDIPGITTDIIARAFHELGRNDAVFGPAADGGYWLAGMRRRPRFIDPFKGIVWSTPTVLRDTLARLTNFKVGLINVLEDVDDLASLDRYPDWYLHNARKIAPGSGRDGS